MGAPDRTQATSKSPSRYHAGKILIGYSCERTRAGLARALSTEADLLILDEPTNHLEIEAQEALEQALRLYPGTVIVVSHDRFFLDALGPEVAWLKLNECEG